MPAGNPYYAYLLRRYMEDRCTLGEREELFVLLEQEGSESHWHELISEMMEEEGPSPDYDHAYWERLLQSILQRPKARVRNLRVWYAAAAVVVLMLVVGWLFLVRGPRSVEQTSSAEARSAQADVEAPTINKAMVTLSDGRMVSLDSIQYGLLADQGGVQLIKQADGQITYNSDGLPTSDPGPIFNTLTNPRGSKVIDLTLSDGSRVWLNAGSSLTYPVEFVGEERKVSITGEAYFEIRHQFRTGSQQLRPFIVEKSSMRVEVLGTFFNVNAYEDEHEIKVTLLQGSVRVKNGYDSILMNPGQQAEIGQEIKIENNIDMAEVMAWKNGMFLFNNTDLKDILKQLGRWYNVDVFYERNVKGRKFTGKISRTVNVSQVLSMLEYAGVHFKIEGNSIIVMK